MKKNYFSSDSKYNFIIGFEKKLLVNYVFLTFCGSFALMRFKKAKKISCKTFKVVSSKLVKIVERRDQVKWSF